ncbi:uncharacterized protein LOC105642744 isoform X2 [Jatropha curcas]|uniref:uncharacterized protein LOC105642744 isoform X2 n=1 Tax=Jatropha curcas TaxID=180498 RepID=UPI0009D6484E|nr:uncharacterized protein LOC105642744 isoform X2 [Jatropha curcas]
MLSLRNFTGVSTALSCSSNSLAVRCHFSYRLALKIASISKIPLCSLKVQELSMEEPLESTLDMKEVVTLMQNDKNDPVPGGQEEEEDKGISKIRVARQKYIPVSKAELLDAIVLKLFDSQDEANEFLLLSSHLDSILHAEHKSILEEMRADYFLNNALDNVEKSDEKLARSDAKSEVNGDKSDSVSDSINGIGNVEERDAEEKAEIDIKLNFNFGLNLMTILGSSAKTQKKCSNGESRLAVSTRFQRAFMQLLKNGQFEELSAGDLTLTSALNSDYLLTLPIYVDWKKASESNAIIFRRGYATERQKGLLIVEKLDYLQSRLLRGIFFLVSKPLEKVGKWIKKAIINAYQTPEEQYWFKKVAHWFVELPLFGNSYSNNRQASDKKREIEYLPDSDVPIWLAAQRAVSRYEGFLSPVGPRGRLLRRLLTWIGLAPSMPETSFELDGDNNASEPHLRPTSLARISLSDIWRPATRKYCGSNIWKMLKTSFSILLSQSVLQDKDDVPSLQLKIYERIPIPDLPVIFPHKKLSFRIIDTIRLDAATILGLSAYFINYKFENILSSPSAIFLDVIAITALIIYVTRVALGYKQTWDRYQLLVNRTLYEKTLASGFGSVHFLLDASEQQQYKEAVLTYAILLKVKHGQINCHRSVGEECERFMYDAFKVKVEMPVEKAMNTLIRLGLVMETPIDGRIRLQAISCAKAEKVLKERWNSLLR